jgi:acyl-CoA dehydrogenase
MPFMETTVNADHHGLTEGPADVDNLTLAPGTSSSVEPLLGMFPTGYIPVRREQAPSRDQYMICK